MFNLKTLSASLVFASLTFAGPVALAGDNTADKQTDTTPIIKPTDQQNGGTSGAQGAQQDHDEVTRQSPYKKTYPQEKSMGRANQNENGQNNGEAGGQTGTSE